MLCSVGLKMQVDQISVISQSLWAPTMRQKTSGMFSDLAQVAKCVMLTKLAILSII